ncbi:hypothetical protein V4889_04040, partial [Ralstonia solanacearum species complex bacterium KE101]
SELASAASVIKRPHLSAVCLLKNCAINFVHRVAALPAAEKRDYAELFRRRQQLVEDFLSVNSLPTASNSYRLLPPRRPETRIITASPPPRPLRFRFRFSAASCSEGRILETFPRLGNTFVVTSE